MTARTLASTKGIREHRYSRRSLGTDDSWAIAGAASPNSNVRERARPVKLRRSLIVSSSWTVDIDIIETLSKGIL
jgi:hypothetical protein